MIVRRRVWLERTALFASLVALGLLLGALGYRLFIDVPWDPLGHYPPQDVTADDTYIWSDRSNATFDIPAIPIGEALHVAGTKCADETVTVRGHVTWTPVEPIGPGFDGGSGTTIRKEGCETFQFVNTPPDEVVEWAEGVLSAGQTPVMRLGGVEYPTRDGTEGESRVWQTEPFAFVAGDD